LQRSKETIALERTSRQKGNLAEDKACGFLKARGFEILERNFYASRFGEVDIIAKKSDIIYFVEVKSSVKNFEAIYNITPKKLKKIIDSAYFYLQKNGIFEHQFCISALIISNDEVEWIESVTE